MYHYKQEININYPMATLPSSSSSNKSRGDSLFYQQAKLHASESHRSLDQTMSENTKNSVANKFSQSTFTHRRLPLSVTESYAHSNGDDNVKLISVHHRPEDTYIKEIPPSAPSLVSLKLLETEFPVQEINNIPESESIVYETLPSTNAIAKVFDYLTVNDNMDNEQNTNEQEYHSDSFDDENDNYYDDDRCNNINANVFHQAPQINNDPNDGHSDPSLVPDTNDRCVYDKLDHDTSKMAYSSPHAINDDFDSETDNSSHEDDEQIQCKTSTNEDDDEYKNQMTLRQQQILWGIVQEWSRKEELYCNQLQKMEEQFKQISAPNNLLEFIQQLIEHHKKVREQIENFYHNDLHPINLIKRLTLSVEILMQTLPIYSEYINANLAPIRKLFEKRANTNGLSSESILSIPSKQFLEILSQIQDLYQTALSFEPDDHESIKKLYNCAHTSKLYGSRQYDNINKVILKNEDVVTMSSRGSRDRCRLILYPDVIVCCHIKTKLLASPKYMILWFIPVLDLDWKVPEKSSNDNLEADDELKTNLKSVYKEYERTAKTSNTISSRLTKNIRKQESEFNLSQSKLELILLNSSSSSSQSTILFSSAYQRQDWIDLIEKSKQELLQRSSANINQSNNQQRLNDSLVQKRLDLIKPNLTEINFDDLPHHSQTLPQTKTYSGTLRVQINSIEGSALCNPIRQYQTLPLLNSKQETFKANYQYYVAVEIDSYNTFHPYAQTSRQSIGQQQTVEFKGELFKIELEHSLAFRLLIYRIDASIHNSTNSLHRAVCIGKFHRNIETALMECRNSSNDCIYLESESGDLKVEISLKHSTREGTFKRQASKRSIAVFGKSIGQLMAVPEGLIDGIPRIVVQCIEIVNRDGLNETGIYRVCCVASDLQMLRRLFDRSYHLGEEKLNEKNVHVAANLLKLFFRELPEPIFSSKLYKQFLNAVQLSDGDNQRVSLLKTFELLENENRLILFYLFDHLIRISDYSHVNMMHLDNLAVVFGPTLMRPSKLITTATGPADDQMSSELQGSMHQCQVVLACLKLRRDGILK